jgi:hypothetical protein
MLPSPFDTYANCYLEAGRTVLSQSLSDALLVMHEPVYTMVDYQDATPGQTIYLAKLSSVRLYKVDLIFLCCVVVATF